MGLIRMGDDAFLCIDDIIVGYIGNGICTLSYEITRFRTGKKLDRITEMLDLYKKVLNPDNISDEEWQEIYKARWKSVDDKKFTYRMFRYSTWEKCDRYNLPDVRNKKKKKSTW